MPRKWTLSEIPNLSGKIAVVTGSNSGAGMEVALNLAQAGAHVVLAVRNEVKAGAAVAEILRLVPSASLSFIPLDLSSLPSISNFVSRFEERWEELDILVNNCGILGPSQRETTEEGFELTLATNFLGHFYLTSLLLRFLASTTSPGDARVVNVCSSKAANGRIRFEDLMGVKSYRRRKAYAQSKLALLTFTVELQRKSDACGWGITAVAAHPGDKSCLTCGRGCGVAEAIDGSPKYRSCLPILYAATAEAVGPGDYYGPSGGCRFKSTNEILSSSIPKSARSEGQKLWEVACKLTKSEWLEDGFDAIWAEDARSGAGERLSVGQSETSVGTRVQINAV